MLPNGTMQLIVNLRDANLSDRHCKFPWRSLVSGPHSDYVDIDAPRGCVMMGVYFKPGGAYPFLGLPAYELYNLTISLESIWGGAACELRERLLQASSPATRFLVLEQALAARAWMISPCHGAVALALRAFHTVPTVHTVGEVVARSGFSWRSFIKHFREQVGVTPKQYCRIQRFQATLRRLANGGPSDWPTIAIECGYYDQAHLINEFHRFSGMTPTVYDSCRGVHANHVPLGV